ncbi:MAG: phosphohydrolase, partial [Oscillospiraceae bacterium]
MITPETLKKSEAINTYITRADEALIALGYTEHSFAHVTRVAQFAEDLLLQLNYDKRTAELAWMAGYL